MSYSIVLLHLSIEVILKCVCVLSMVLCFRHLEEIDHYLPYYEMIRNGQDTSPEQNEQGKNKHCFERGIAVMEARELGRKIKYMLDRCRKGKLTVNRCHLPGML